MCNLKTFKISKLFTSFSSFFVCDFTLLHESEYSAEKLLETVVSDWKFVHDWKWEHRSHENFPLSFLFFSKIKLFSRFFIYFTSKMIFSNIFLFYNFGIGGCAKEINEWKCGWSEHKRASRTGISAYTFEGLQLYDWMRMKSEVNVTAIWNVCYLLQSDEIQIFH